MPTMAQVINGWQMNVNSIGVYGDFYAKRGVVAMMGLGANQAEDAVYPLLMADANGDNIEGSRDYLLHFDKGQLPPVAAFWSVTMYDEHGFQVANEINRFAIGDRDPLVYNPTARSTSTSSTQTLALTESRTGFLHPMVP